MDRECRWCALARSMYGAGRQAEIKEFVNSIPADQRADEATHARRLEICSGCSACVNGVCRFCGCIVAARAAKKALDCPDPNGSRWAGRGQK